MISINAMMIGPDTRRRPLMTSLVLFVALFLATVNATQMYYDNRDGDVGHMKDVMMSYGVAETECSFMLENVPRDVDLTEKDVKVIADSGVERGDVRITDNGGGRHNVTVGLGFTGFGGGKKKIKVDVGIKEERIWVMGYIGCMGVEIGDSGMAGEEGKGLRWDSWKDVEDGKSLKVTGYGKGGEKMSDDDIARGFRTEVRDGKGLIDKEGVKMSDGSMRVRPNKYRVSSEPVPVKVTVETLEMDGEVFETVLLVEVSDKGDAAPPVVMGPAKIEVDTSKDDYVSLDCFNMKTNRRTVTDVTMVAGGMKFSMDASKNDMGDVDQKIVLRGKQQEDGEEGEYTPKITAKFDDGSSEEVIQDGTIDVELRNRASAIGGGESEDADDEEGGGLSASVWGPILGAGLFVIIAAIVLGAWWYSSRRSAADESSYSSSGPIGVPDAVDPTNNGIARDIYARGELHLSPNGDNCSIIDENGERHVFGRSPSSNGRSSFVSSKYSV